MRDYKFLIPNFYSYFKTSQPILLGCDPIQTLFGRKFYCGHKLGKDENQRRRPAGQAPIRRSSENKAGVFMDARLRPKARH